MRTLKMSAWVWRRQTNLDGRMNEKESNLQFTADSRALAQSLAGYREPNCARSIFEIVITVLPLVLLWLLMWASLEIGYWLCLLLSVPAAGFLVRLFMIQHDCGHGSFSVGAE
jgi:acyl-lipid omega-6 desaturase (Delta-12 desaturase)